MHLDAHAALAIALSTAVSGMCLTGLWTFVSGSLCCSRAAAPHHAPAPLIMMSAAHLFGMRGIYQKTFMSNIAFCSRAAAASCLAPMLRLIRTTLFLNMY